MSPALDDRISARIGAIAESATLAVDAKAKALKAQGRPVIGFGAGEPDFPTPEHIVQAAVQACSTVKYHRYTPAAGLPELREAVAQASMRDAGLEIESSQVLITNGGKHALYNTFATVLNPGDEVLLPGPYWTTYPESIGLTGAHTVVVPTSEDTGYRVSVDMLEAAYTERTKMLVFVSPSNPTGAVYTPEQVRQIGQWAASKNIWVVTDEIYQHLVYGQAKFSSMPVEVPELAPRCIVVNGVAKTFAMTGWRVGWMVGPKDVIKAAGNLQSHATSNVCNISQAAAIAALQGGLEDVHRMRDAFDIRRQTMVGLLNEIPGVVCPEPEGAFYAFPSVTGVLGRTVRGRVLDSSAALCEAVLDEAEVALVPGEAFGAPGYVRLSYALSDADLATGLGRFKALLEEAN